MSDTTDTCPYCGGPVVRLPACRWCGMVIATIGEAADRLSGDAEFDYEPHCGGCNEPIDAATIELDD